MLSLFLSPTIGIIKFWDYTMNKPYDLEERTFLFAKECRNNIRSFKNNFKY